MFSKGQKLFSERVVSSMIKEYKQMDDMKVLDAVDPDKFSSNQKRKVLRAVSFIKQKRNGNVKGRMYANGVPHRKFVLRKEVRSLTMSLESLMTSLMINLHETRAVSIFDVTGVYLQTDLPQSKFALLLLEDQFIDIMVEVNLEYADCVRIVNGKKVLCVRILKAIYGMIESALLWYELYVNVLKGVGFELNLYDMCVSNKYINVKQCTLAWYVYDNQISYAEQSVIDNIIQKMEDKFPGLTVSEEDYHTFLGIKL